MEKNLCQINNNFCDLRLASIERYMKDQFQSQTLEVKVSSSNESSFIIKQMIISKFIECSFSTSKSKINCW